VLYKLTCGCVVLPVETAEAGYWTVRDIERCDDESDDGGFWLSGARHVPVVAGPYEGGSQVAGGRYLTEEEDEHYFSSLRSLVADGYRFRRIRQALSAPALAVPEPPDSLRQPEGERRPQVITSGGVRLYWSPVLRRYVSVPEKEAKDG
jgi:hypothetical protein